MNDLLTPVSEALQKRFHAVPSTFREELTLTLPADDLVAACDVVKNEFKFGMLENLTAVDYWPEESPRFHVVYMFYSFELNTSFQIRVPLTGNAPLIPTIEKIYPNANWHEREVWDMFGIRFEGHSDLRRILMPEDWQGHPQRKDYPLGYEEVQFTFNFDEIDQRKPYARE